MAVLSTPEKKLGKMLHSSSLRSSTLSHSGSTHAVEPMSAMKLSKQATCLSQLRFCSQLSPHATDSRPDSPVRQGNTVAILAQSATVAQSPSGTARAHKGPYWTRWKSGRKSCPSSETKSVTEEPSTPIRADSRLPADRTTTVRRALNASFEFDMPADAISSGPGTPQLPAGPTNSTTSNESSCNPPSQSRTSITLLSDTSSEKSLEPGSPLGVTMSPENPSAEAMAQAISVKEVITERLPLQQTMSIVDQNYTGGASVKEIILPQSPKQPKAADGGQTCNRDTASLPRFFSAPINLDLLRSQIAQRYVRGHR